MGKRQQAVMLQEIAEIQLGRRMPTKAIKAAQEALLLFHEFADCNGVQRAERASALALQLKDKMRQAAKAAKPLLRMYYQTGDPRALYEGALQVYGAGRNPDEGDGDVESGEPPDVLPPTRRAGDEELVRGRPVQKVWGADFGPAGLRAPGEVPGQRTPNKGMPF